MIRALQRDELGVLRHALGLSASGRGTPYRGHFVTSEGSDDHDACVRLVELGCMARRPPSQLSGGGDVFIVTEQGKATALATVDPEPALTPSARRYKRYLDADSGLPFGEWLKAVRA